MAALALFRRMKALTHLYFIPFQMPHTFLNKLLSINLTAWLRPKHFKDKEVRRVVGWRTHQQSIKLFNNPFPHLSMGAQRFTAMNARVQPWTFQLWGGYFFFSCFRNLPVWKKWNEICFQSNFQLWSELTSRISSLFLLSIREKQACVVVTSGQSTYS